MSFNQTIEEPLAAIRTGVSQWWDLPQHKQTCWPLAWSHHDIYKRNYSLAWWIKRDGKEEAVGGLEGEKEIKMDEETKRKERKIGCQQLRRGEESDQVGRSWWWLSMEMLGTDKRLWEEMQQVMKSETDGET